jgi:SM-20-related protein
LPCGNQMVVFDSNLRHEVQAAQQTRRSIAGWLRRDQS